MKNVLEYLENTTEKYADKTAVIDINGKCTYSELLAKSKAAGTELVKYTDPRKSVVCFMSKSIMTLESFFGIAYAGCFYTLVDPDFPKERVQQILSVLEPSVIITDKTQTENLDKLGEGYKVIFAEDFKDEVNEDALASVRSQAVDTDPLYCNFTSGSTGVPKGVLVGHKSVIDFIDTFTETFGIDETDVIGNQAPFDFDVSVKDIYSAIKTGASLVIIPKEYFMFPVKVIDMLEDNHVTTLIWAVSALCMLIRLHGFKYKVPSAIKRIMFSGEVMPIKQFNKLKKVYPDITYVNLYGPTEITCNCAYYVVDREFENEDKMPMGIPFDNEKIILLDENDKEVKDGEQGELCVCGSALALGYYRNPENTAKSFTLNPLNNCYPEMMYRTGDLAYREDGLLYFAGRKDFQIKHMGHRIELEEIEAVLGGVEGVSHGCCAYDERRNKVVAFYKGTAEVDFIKESMKISVPDYMVPNVFKQLDEIPLTKNGKTDRKLLFSMYKEGEI